ncbi:hypothetical protein BN2475_40081 [Paraburkholderia ribeironis]|uniref:Uncharacterized protein n=1 Tax=Paraburkholderia ribeironis TaxID=1247936 RepID=A0A1N7RJI8_9BURK|nr:hypothetical protein BN2475_40081 [Paraburkholderia ribeironis]
MRVTDFRKAEKLTEYRTRGHPVTFLGSRYNKGFAELIDNLRGEAGGRDPWDTRRPIR